MNADYVSNFLRDHHIRGEVVLLDHQAPTVEDAARVLGVTPDSIIKSVVLLADSIPILAIANGTTRIDLKRLADYLGIARKRVKLADAETVLELTGFRVGGVPPFAHRTPLRTLVEDRVLIQQEVFGGGGEVHALLRITPTEIVRVTSAEVLSLAEKL